MAVISETFFLQFRAKQGWTDYAERKSLSAARALRTECGLALEKTRIVRRTDEVVDALASA